MEYIETDPYGRDYENEGSNAMRKLADIPSDQNFCHVFELPESYPPGFCFGNGRPVIMQMVDWFQPFPDLSAPCFSEVAKLKYWEDWVPRLVEHIRGKVYIKPGRKYLVVTDFDEAIIIAAATEDNQ